MKFPPINHFFSRLVAWLISLSLFTARYKRQRGAAMSEFVVTLPALLLIGLGTLQGGLMYHAKNTVNYATFEAARKGAVNHAQVAPMQEELGIRLAPLFGGDGSPEMAVAAITRGTLEARDPRYTKIEILNPTQEAFEDFGVENDDGIIEIPNDNLRYRSRDIGATSKMHLQDANLLKIRVTYAYNLTVPLIQNVLPAMMSWIDPDNADYYMLGRMPVSAVATVRMQSPAQESGANVSSESDGGSGVIPGDPGDNEENGDDGETNDGDETDNSDDGADNGDNTNDGSSGDDGQSDNGSNTDDTSNNGGSDTSGDNDADSGSTDDSGTGDGNTDGDGNNSNDGNSPEEEVKVECTTSWEDPEYQFEESDGWFDAVLNAPDNLETMYYIVKDFFDGLIEGFGNQISDLAAIILDPSILWDMAKAAIDDPLGFIESVIEGVLNDVETVLECGPKDIGRIVGENANPVVFLKALSTVAGSTRLAKYADDVESRPKDADGNYIGEKNPEIDGVNCAISSFVSGTPVSTPNGRRPIETLVKGELVHSRSDLSFNNRVQSIAKSFGRVANGYQQIETEFGVIKATDNHPFWVQGKGWTDAKKLKEWDVVASLKGDVLIKSNTWVEEEVQVHNFTVNGTYSYFVGDGGLWVHNCPAIRIGSYAHANWRLRHENALGDISDNYFSYETVDGRVIVSRKDASIGERYEFTADGEFKVATNNVDVRANFESQTFLNHADLNVSVDIEINGVRHQGNVGDVLSQLETERNAAVERRNDALAVSDNEAVREAVIDMRNISEQLGEVSAQAWVKSEFPDAGDPIPSVLPGGGKQGEFDQVYIDRDSGKLILVEAKGGSASWGDAKTGDHRVQQGTKAYMDNLIANYRDVYNRTNDPALEELIDAFNEVRTGSLEIEYYGIKQKANDNGINGSIDVFKFDLVTTDIPQGDAG